MPGHVSSVSGSSVSRSFRVDDRLPSKGARHKWIARAVVLFLIAIISGTLALRYLTRLDSLVENAAPLSHHMTFSALSPAFFGIAGLSAFLFFIVVLHAFNVLLTSLRRTSLPVKQPLPAKLHQDADPLIPDEPPAAALEETLMPPHTPAPVLRNSNSAQRKAIHAAALVAIETRSFRACEASGPRRRSSDYDGPRRRSTDKKPVFPAFKGPNRRTADLATEIVASSSVEGGVGRHPTNPPGTN